MNGAAARDRLCPCRVGAELAGAGGTDWIIGGGGVALFEVCGGG